MLLPHEKEILVREVRESVFDKVDIAFILKCIANSKIDGTDLQQAVLTVDKLQKKYKAFSNLKENRKEKKLKAGPEPKPESKPETKTQLKANDRKLLENS